MRSFDLHIRDLERGEDLAFTLSGVSSLAWAEDSETIYYTLIDETLRSTKAFASALQMLSLRSSTKSRTSASLVV